MKTRNWNRRQQGKQGGIAIAICVMFGMATATAFGQGAGPKPGELQERVQDIKQRLDGQLSSLDALYKEIHSHPELSLQEEHTSARLARELRDLGFEIKEKVGG
jgi:hypothetical protein